MTKDMIVELSSCHIPKQFRLTANDFLECYPDFSANKSAEILDIDGYTDEEEGYRDGVIEFIDGIQDIVTYDEKDNSITIAHKNNLLRSMYQEVSRYLKDFNEENFSKSQWRWKLRELVYPVYGTYICMPDPVHILHFLENCKNGDKFYIGGILYY